MTDVDPVLSAAAAVHAAALPADAVLLVLASAPELGDLCRAIHPGSVLEAQDAREVHDVIRTATGRADAVVTTHAARSAVKAVRRGGVVCLPWTDVDAPSVTEIVQREVRLVGVESTAALQERYAHEVERCRIR